MTQVLPAGTIEGISVRSPRAGSSGRALGGGISWCDKSNRRRQIRSGQTNVVNAVAAEYARVEGCRNEFHLLPVVGHVCHMYGWYQVFSTGGYNGGSRLKGEMRVNG